MKKEKVFSGVATALITPMKKKSIDYSALSKLIEFQIEGGTDALVIGGTTGEAATLSDGERYELYTYVKEKVAGRVKLIFGTGTNDTRVAVRHTKTAADIGADAALVVTPYYNKGTHDGVVRHYKKIAASCDLPIILYNVPSRTGVNLTVAQLEELAKLDGIVGIKEASDSADRLVELAAFGEDLWLYAGNDTQIYQTLALGGAGVVSVVSNLYPERLSRICKSFFAGDTKMALQEQFEILEFTKTMFLETNPAPIKYAMSLAGLCRPDIRLPLLTPKRKTRTAIKNVMRELKQEG